MYLTPTLVCMYVCVYVHTFHVFICLPALSYSHSTRNCTLSTFSRYKLFKKFIKYHLNTPLKCILWIYDLTLQLVSNDCGTQAGVV